MLPVQHGRKRGRWSAEQKLAVLQEWQQGVPVEEVCRRHGLNASQPHRWKQALDRGLKDQGELIPKNQVAISN